MKKLDKRILDSQIEVFSDWSRRYATISPWADRPLLELFAIHTIKTDILDVDDNDVEMFIHSGHGNLKYPHVREDARKVIHKMRRFYAARTKNALTRLSRGRPPHISQIAKTQEYRKKGLKLQDISTLMGKPLSLIHRWIHYPLNKGGE